MLSGTINFSPNFWPKIHSRNREHIFTIFTLETKIFLQGQSWHPSTGNDRYSGHGYSGIDRYSGTKTPDDAILFTVSGITTIVEQKFRFFEAQSYKSPLIFSKKLCLNLWLPIYQSLGLRDFCFLNSIKNCIRAVRAIYRICNFL